MFWTVAGWIIWGLVALIALGCILSANRDLGVRFMMRVQGVVLALGVVATAVFPVSKFHLLWVFPVAFIIPMIIMSARVGRVSRQFEALANDKQAGGKDS